MLNVAVPAASVKTHTMKIALVIFASALALLLAGASGCSRNPDVDSEVAVLETSYGKIVIEFLPGVAPKAVRNFKDLARENFYDGTKFHRIVKDKNKIVAIQGGDPNTINGDPQTWGSGQPNQKTVPAEISSLKHERGTVSAARKPNDPNSATSQFYICIGPQPSLDGQYTIFGRVIEGMNVVDSIAFAPAIPKVERPIDPVVVDRAYIVKREEIKTEAK
jgi:peptidyl-prolyl cis-trans isomerase B (cyclophilin B)